MVVPDPDARTIVDRDAGRIAIAHETAAHVHDTVADDVVARIANRGVQRVRAARPDLHEPTAATGDAGKVSAASCGNREGIPVHVYPRLPAGAGEIAGREIRFQPEVDLGVAGYGKSSYLGNHIVGHVSIAGAGPGQVGGVVVAVRVAAVQIPVERIAPAAALVDVAVPVPDKVRCVRIRHEGQYERETNGRDQDRREGTIP